MLALASRRPLLAALVTLTLPMACAAPDDGERLGVDCGGKCDGFDDIKALIHDPSELDVGDLVRVGAPFVTDEINNLLSFSDYAELRLDDTKVFGAGELDQLVTGLAARYGESELSTAVNRIRADHLTATGDSVYGESSFALKGKLAADFALDTGDVSGNLRLGFLGGEIAVHMVAAYDGDTDAILQSPLRAVRDAGREFVLPRGIDDLRAMKPGESIGMSADGALGINIGVGVPILVADPLSALTYKLVLTAGLRSTLEGQLDVQVVRMDGDELVVDVGIEQARVKSARVAVSDGWGVQGLVSAEVEIGPVNVDLGRLVERALEKQLNKRLDLIHATAERTSRASRMSVARFRFDLGAADPALAEPAIAQALRGDVRLAQALANRGEPGVDAEFDLSRSGVSATSYAGLEIAGMNFFFQQIENSGSVVVQTPGGARSILFDSLHRSSGWFFSRHGFTRVALSSIGFDAEGDALPTGEANLVIGLDEGDDATEVDKFADYLDSLIVSVAGPAALAGLEESGNALEQLVTEECRGVDAFDPCRTEMVNDPRSVALRDQAMADFERELGDVGPEVADLLRRAAELRLMDQSVYEFPATFTGPGISMTSDFRLDEAALAALFAQGAGARVRQAALAVAGATEIDRRDSMAQIEADRKELAADLAGDLDAAEALADDYGARYRRALAIEAASIERLGGIGARAIEVHFDVDEQNRADYASAAANTLPARRAALAAEFFDRLRDTLDDVGNHAEQTAGFAILGALTPDRADLRLDLDFEFDGDVDAGYQLALPGSADSYARGQAVAPIDGGLFAVDQLISLD